MSAAKQGYRTGTATDVSAFIYFQIADFYSFPFAFLPTVLRPLFLYTIVQNGREREREKKNQKNENRSSFKKSLHTEKIQFKFILLHFNFAIYGRYIVDGVVGMCESLLCVCVCVRYCMRACGIDSVVWIIIIVIIIVSWLSCFRLCAPRCFMLVEAQAVPYNVRLSG